MDAEGLAGWLLAIGSVCFLIGAFNPPLFRVWTASADEYLRLIAGHRGAWRATNILFATATVLTAGGLWLVPAAVGPGGDAMARAAAAAYSLAAALWLGSLAFRLSMTVRVASEFAAGGSIDATYRSLAEWAGGLFVAFTLIAGGSLIAVGVAVLAGGDLSALVGWFAILVGAVVVVGYLRFGDMPPFVSYLPTGVLGIVVLLAAR